MQTERYIDIKKKVVRRTELGPRVLRQNENSADWVYAYCEEIAAEYTEPDESEEQTSQTSTGRDRKTATVNRKAKTETYTEEKK